MAEQTKKPNFVEKWTAHIIQFFIGGVLVVTFVCAFCYHWWNSIHWAWENSHTVLCLIIIAYLSACVLYFRGRRLTPKVAETKETSNHSRQTGSLMKWLALVLIVQPAVISFGLFIYAFAPEFAAEIERPNGFNQALILMLYLSSVAFAIGGPVLAIVLAARIVVVMRRAPTTDKQSS